MRVLRGRPDTRRARREMDAGERPMCDECDESSALYVAYFNKPGGKRWRPARMAAVSTLAVGRHSVEPIPVTAREVRSYDCDEESAGRR